MDHGAVPSAAATRVDNTVNGGCGYVAERDRQVRFLLQPGVSPWSELPNHIGHGSIDSETAQDIELVIKHSEAARQSYSVTVTRPRRSNGFDRIGDRVVTKHSISGCRLAAC